MPAKSGAFAVVIRKLGEGLAKLQPLLISQTEILAIAAKVLSCNTSAELQKW